MKKFILATGLALAMSGAAHAQSVTETASDAAGAVTGAVASLWDGWSGTATFGATSSTGNAEASSVSGGLRVGKTVGQWEHLAFGTILFGEQTVVRLVEDADGNPVIDQATNAQQIDVFTANASERISLGYQPKYYWRPNTYFFGILDWEQDEPANIDTSTRQLIGVGHRFWSTDQGYFSGEAGFGNKVLEPVTGDDLSGGIAYLGLNYLNRISENTTFNADMRADLGGDNTFVEIGLGLAYKISERLALKVSYFTRGNTDLALDDATNPLSSDNDTVTTFNLVLDI